MENVTIQSIMWITSITVLVGFAIQQLLQVLDFWLTILLAQRYERKFCKYKDSLFLAFPVYKRSSMGLISTIFGVLVATFVPEVRLIDALHHYTEFGPRIGDVLVTGLALGAGTEGANTIAKYLGGFKDAIQAKALLSKAQLPGLSSEKVEDETAAGFTYGGGRLIESVEIHAFFWGSEWTSGAHQNLMQSLEDFLDRFVKGPIIEQLAEFNTTSYSIRAGHRASSQVVHRNSNFVKDATSAAESSSEVWTAIGNWISDSGIAINENSHFCIYLPEGVKVGRGVNVSCTDFYAYHQSTPEGLSYSVMPYPCEDDLNRWPNPLDVLTIRTSHEICESITNPVGQGWTSGRDEEEVCDFCNLTSKSVDGALVQMVSNMGGACQ